MSDEAEQAGDQSALASDWAAAQKHYQRACGQGPASASSWFKLGKSFCKQKRYAEAVAPLETSTSLPYPAGEEAHLPWFWLGRARYRSGDLAGSIPAWERTVRLAIVPGAYYNLACAHARLGNVSAAVQNLGVACGYDVQMVGLARADADFDGIRETHAFNSVLWEYEPGRVVETYVFQIRALDYGIGLRFAGAEAKKHWVELVKSTAYVPTGDTARWSEATEELAEVITDEPMEEVVRYCQDQVFIAPDDIVELLEFPESCVVTFDYGLRVEVWPLAPYR